MNRAEQTSKQSAWKAITEAISASSDCEMSARNDLLSKMKKDVSLKKKKKRQYTDIIVDLFEEDSPALMVLISHKLPIYLFVFINKLILFLPLNSTSSWSELTMSHYGHLFNEAAIQFQTRSMPLFHKFVKAAATKRRRQDDLQQMLLEKEKWRLEQENIKQSRKSLKKKIELKNTAAPTRVKQAILLYF